MQIMKVPTAVATKQQRTASLTAFMVGSRNNKEGIVCLPSCLPSNSNNGQAKMGSGASAPKDITQIYAYKLDESGQGFTNADMDQWGWEQLELYIARQSDIRQVKDIISALAM